MSSICLVSLDEARSFEARSLAKALALDFISEGTLDPKATLRDQRRFQKALLKDRIAVLLYDSKGLSLLAQPDAEPFIIRADFCDPTTQYRQDRAAGKHEMIAKAVGIKPQLKPSVLDCTAGMGADAYILAALGCKVTLLERNPIAHALLADAITRAKHSENLKIIETIARMQLLPPIEAAAHLRQINTAERVAVVYLDPMFPAKEKSAQVKKAMQVFHSLIGKDGDSGELLSLALAVAAQKVVVKRPRHAAPLNDQQPSYSLEGQRNRYDIYLTKGCASMG